MAERRTRTGGKSGGCLEMFPGVVKASSSSASDHRAELTLLVRQSSRLSSSFPPPPSPSCRPHKVAICSRLDDLTEDGRNIGACNTVIIRKGPNGERQLGSSFASLFSLFCSSLPSSNSKRGADERKTCSRTQHGLGRCQGESA